jgi:Helicase C-terminal domain
LFLTSTIHFPGIPFAPHFDPWVILKKQYLDERATRQTKPACASTTTTTSVPYQSAAAVYGSKANANSSITSIKSENQAPNTSGNASIHTSSAYSAYSAYAAYPAYPTVNTANSNIPPIDGQSHGTSAPIMPPAPPIQTVTSAFTAQPHMGGYNQHNQNKSARTEPPLTGQSWYTQSASRAVNQAIGRVIRHQKDWGAIFLLDDRFMPDKQASQLSSWVRPRLKKYTVFSQALQDFRTFISAAMNDNDLKVQYGRAYFSVCIICRFSSAFMIRSYSSSASITCHGNLV